MADASLIALRSTYDAYHGSLSCSCHELRDCGIDSLKSLCVVHGLSSDGDKRTLLCRLCATCATVADVGDQLDAVDHERVAAKWWRPKILNTSLSVVDAYHIAVRKAAAAELVLRADSQINAAAANPPWVWHLDRFRAHTMKHLVTNYNYYITKGRSNRANGSYSLMVGLFMDSIDFSLYY